MSTTPAPSRSISTSTSLKGDLSLSGIDRFAREHEVPPKDLSPLPFRYRPDIDGLRGIAVMAVLLFHFKMGLPGGFVGVDVFFVISGYLISSLLWNERVQGKIDLKQFWCRRARRLFPALSVILTATTLAVLVLLPGPEVLLYAESLAAQLAVVSNIYFWKTTNYFGPTSEMQVLLHTWSLAVEEQFYIVLPFFLSWTRRWSVTLLLCCVISVTGLSLIGCVLSTAFSPGTAFYLLPTRAWELLAGVLLAIFCRTRATSPSSANRRWTNEASLIGLLMIATPMVMYSSQTSFPGIAALLPVLGTVLLIWSSEQNLSIGGRCVAMEPLRCIGLASYSIYLWHWPVMSLATFYGMSETFWQRLLLLALGGWLGWLSYIAVECPSRRSVWFQSTGNVVKFSAASLVTLIAITGALLIGRGFPTRLPADARKLAATSQMEHPWNRDVSLNEVLNGEFPTAHRGGASTIFLWGDSHAMAAMPGICQLASVHDVRVRVATRSFTPPAIDFRHPDNVGANGRTAKLYSQAVLDHLVNSEIDHVLLIGAWQKYVDLPDFRDGFVRVVESLSQAQKKVFVMHQVPQHPRSLPQSLSLARWWSTSTEPLIAKRAEYLADRRSVERLFESLGDQVTILDPLEAFFPNQSEACRILTGDELNYYDAEHLTSVGSMLLQPVVLPILP